MSTLFESARDAQFNRQCTLHTVQHTTQHTMRIQEVEELMHGGGDKPLSAAQQKWMRVDGDAGNEFKKSMEKEIDDELLYGAFAEDTVTYLKYVCANNKKRGIKLKYELRRKFVDGLHSQFRRQFWRRKAYMYYLGNRSRRMRFTRHLSRGLRKRVA